jgi:hypothetical protein
VLRLSHFAFALVALWASGVKAQLPPLAEVSAQYLPPSQVPDNGQLRAQISSYDGAFSVPVALSKRTFLVPGAQYHVDSISYHEAPADFIRLDALHSLELPVMLVHVLAQRWALALRLAPGAAGDFDTYDSGALRFGGLLMASWTPNEHLTLGGGALASYAFGELLPLPMLYVDWKPRTWLKLEASLPFNASALFVVAERFELGALADVSGNEYAIRKPNLREHVDHLAYSLVSAGAIARARVFSSLWFQAFVGHTLFRRYDLKDARGEPVPDGSVELPNALIFRAGFVFRIPTPDSDDRHER